MTGKMTSSNIKGACESNGLVATCACDRDSGCTETALADCDYPMTELSQDMCGERLPEDCSSLHDVFIYYSIVHSYDGVSGHKTDSFISGKKNENKYALCAREGGKLT